MSGMFIAEEPRKTRDRICLNCYDDKAIQERGLYFTSRGYWVSWRCTCGDVAFEEGARNPFDEIITKLDRLLEHLGMRP